jgi:hypothetical protein
MDESSSTAFVLRDGAGYEKVSGGECGRMAYMQGGFAIFGLVRGIFEAAMAIAFIWLVYKLGRLAEAYTAKLKRKS